MIPLGCGGGLLLYICAKGLLITRGRDEHDSASARLLCDGASIVNTKTLGDSWGVLIPAGELAGLTIFL